MTIVITKDILNDLIAKVSNNEITLDQYQAILLNQATKIDKNIKKKDIIEQPKRTIDTINEMAQQRKEQIKRWKKANPGATELETINTDDTLVQQKIQEMLDKGATKIEKPKYHKLEELKETLGNRLFISYITKKGAYRSGGFLTANSEHYFVLLGGQATNKISFSVQYSKIQAIYVRKVKAKTSKKYIKPVPSAHEKTKYVVKVGDVPVYYGKDNFDKNRFMSTKKYAGMMRYHKKHN